jgi:hypothetical protein
MLKPAFGFSFEELYQRDGLVRLDAQFLKFLSLADAALAVRLSAGRADPDALDARAESALILNLSPHLEQFLAELFGITSEATALSRRHEEQAPLFSVKRQFVQRRAAGRIKPEEAQDLDGPSLERELRRLFGGRFDELTYARHVTGWLENEAAHGRELDLATRYAAWAVHTQAGREQCASGVLFTVPAKIDTQNLLRQLEKFSLAGATAYRIKPEHLRRRDGFKLTDAGASLVVALDEANYCIWCHAQGKDSCSKGLKEKPAASAPQKIVFKKNTFGVKLAGCPLEEKISEFHTLKAAGKAIAALAVICIDNPMAAATGHRICNDCMKSCIYQKQEPVNIPEA